MKTHGRICIIDDDAIVVFGLKRAMSSLAFTPDLSTFENGLNALDYFKVLLAENSKLPSLIFMDLNMPVMDGWDFLEEFTKLIPPKAHNPRIYIMTSSINNKDLEKAKTYGLDGHYLIKPVSTTALKNILNVIQDVD